MPKHDVDVELIGHDGNAFNILGRVDTALRRAGVSKEERDQYHEEATSGDYDNLLAVTTQWVNVV
jgi:hypothetical protein